MKAFLLVLVFCLAGCAVARESSMQEDGTETFTRSRSWSTTGTVKSNTDLTGLLDWIGDALLVIGGGGTAGVALTRVLRGPPTQKVGLPASKVRDDARQD